jgi:hypothetical protein
MNAVQAPGAGKARAGSIHSIQAPARSARGSLNEGGRFSEARPQIQARKGEALLQTLYSYGCPPRAFNQRAPCARA